MSEWKKINEANFQIGAPVWVRGWDYGKEDSKRHYCFAYWDGGNWIEAGCGKSILQYLTEYLSGGPLYAETMEDYSPIDRIKDAMFKMVGPGLTDKSKEEDDLLSVEPGSCVRISLRLEVINHFGMSVMDDNKPPVTYSLDKWGDVVKRYVEFGGENLVRIMEEIAKKK